MSVKKEKLIRRGMVVAMAIFVTAFGTVMVQAIIKIAETGASQIAVDYTPTEGETPPSKSPVSTTSNSNEVQNNKENIEIPSKMEISSEVPHEESPYKDYFYFVAEKISEDPFTIDFTFSTRDSYKYYMKPYQHFYIKQNDIIYRPISTELLEVVGLDENDILKSRGEGKIRGILTFEGVDPTKTFDFVFNNQRQTTTNGITIRFDN